LRSTVVIVPCARTPVIGPDMNLGHDDIGPPERNAKHAASPPLGTALGFGYSQTKMSVLGERWM
jgi:hypothetical protein